GQGYSIEESQVIDAADVSAGIRGQGNHRYHGQQRGDQFALGRIVVDEDDALEAHVELGGDLAKVRRLVAPVAPDRAKVLPLERQMRVALEHLPDHRKVVLAADREDHAAIAQLAQVVSKRLVSTPLSGLGSEG